MRYCDPKTILTVLDGHPEGMTVRQITESLFPSITTSEYAYAKSWVVTQMMRHKRNGSVTPCGEETSPRGRAGFLWRLV